ncbi:unnamed protein product [Heligmosomoides polygyrus]|uniref:Uncharacterized protein n=1 Tax=Heligmosomoides polygyrus TaxID=6339 RepID=A0A183F5Y9_HELPZ|nr:unnamed protein product [Heligmosomoides polygyrus]
MALGNYGTNLTRTSGQEVVPFRSETATPLPPSRGRNRRTATVEEVFTPQALTSPVLQRQSTLTTSRRARTEASRLKTTSSISSPLATKRVTRRPQHYESDTFSTLTRKRHVITKHPTLREAVAPSFELPRTTARPAPLRPVQPAGTAFANAATSTAPTRRKARTPATTTTTTAVEKKVTTRPRTRAKRSAPVHGICCWNNVCDCVLVDILRSQPLVTLFEKKRKKVKILINPDANEGFTAAEVEEPTPRRTRRGRLAAVESNAAEC